MNKSDHEDNGSDSMPKFCKKCTRYLNDVLPKPSCYTYCPKNDPIKEIEYSLNNNQESILKICPKCQKKTLFWNKLQLLYECLICKRTYSVDALRLAYINDENNKNTTSYLEAGDGYDA
jgi:ribosomal protein L33